jgi:hypothetical protein
MYTTGRLIGSSCFDFLFLNSDFDFFPCWFLLFHSFVVASLALQGNKTRTKLHHHHHYHPCVCVCLTVMSSPDREIKSVGRGV